MNASVLSQAQTLQNGCDLPKVWSDQPCWRILDTGFEPLRFLLNWQAWRWDEERPQLLHYVALVHQAPDLLEIAEPDTSVPELQSMAQQLAQQCHGLIPGFHRLSFDQGRVLLTLCIGELRAMLREQQFTADSVYLDSRHSAAPWDRWDIKALSRCCRRGTTLSCLDPTLTLVQDLAHSGFEMTSNRGRFNPRWDIKTTREKQRYKAASPGSSAVIGAGLAGASVAAALARRGWQVQVLDAAPAPAAGASGLPAGLVVAHVSADDSPRSRLSRNGVRLTLQQAAGLLQEGQDWQASGVLEKGLGIKPDLWHRHAGWIKPAELIRVWLSQPGIHFCGNSRVDSLIKVNGDWELRDESGKVLASARHVVLANALPVQALLARLRLDHKSLQNELDSLPELHGMRGAVSWGLRQTVQSDEFPPYPVNGSGSLIPEVPFNGGAAWYTGATYEPSDQLAMGETLQHQANLDKLKNLLPMTAQALLPIFKEGSIQLWSGIRCVSQDRMPLVGALESGDAPSLWISTAMGSRGLSFAVLCAELLAAQMGAEPWPVEASLARFLQATRRPDQALI